MENQKPEADNGQRQPGLAPATCSASRCEWWTGNKKQGLETCPNQADWQWPNPRGKIWKLCDAHKRLVLESYNDATRKKEEPEWTRIVPPNVGAEPPRKEKYE